MQEVGKPYVYQLDFRVSAEVLYPVVPVVSFLYFPAVCERLDLLLGGGAGCDNIRFWNAAKSGHVIDVVDEAAAE